MNLSTATILYTSLKKLTQVPGNDASSFHKLVYFYMHCVF